jgi:hypothetical protein
VGFMGETGPRWLGEGHVLCSFVARLLCACH